MTEWSREHKQLMRISHIFLKFMFIRGTRHKEIHAYFLFFKTLRRQLSRKNSIEKLRCLQIPPYDVEIILTNERSEIVREDKADEETA